MTIRGAFEATVSGEFDDVPKELDAYTIVHVPDGSSIDEPAIATLILADEAGHAARAETAIWLKDTRPPLVRLDFGGLHFDGSIRPSESLDLHVNAADNHQLTHIGYEGAGLRDSVVATSIGDSHTFRLTVPQSWLMQRQVLRAWARDTSGNVSEITGIGGREVPVYKFVDRAVTTFHLPSEYNSRVHWDPKRNAVYADPPVRGG